MTITTFADNVSRARRLLMEAQDVLNAPWQGPSPTEQEIERLDETREQLATALRALGEAIRLTHRYAGEIVSPRATELPHDSPRGRAARVRG